MNIISISVESKRIPSNSSTGGITIETLLCVTADDTVFQDFRQLNGTIVNNINTVCLSKFTYGKFVLESQRSDIADLQINNIS